MDSSFRWNDGEWFHRNWNDGEWFHRKDSARASRAWVPAFAGMTEPSMGVRALQAWACAQPSLK